MNATLEDVTVARTWMNTMSAGASKNGIPIQLCMPMPRHLLQSVEMPAVTQVRLTNKVYNTIYINSVLNIAILIV